MSNGVIILPTYWANSISLLIMQGRKKWWKCVIKRQKQRASPKAEWSNGVAIDRSSWVRIVMKLPVTWACWCILGLFSQLIRVKKAVYEPLLPVSVGRSQVVICIVAVLYVYWQYDLIYKSIQNIDHFIETNYDKICVQMLFISEKQGRFVKLDPGCGSDLSSKAKIYCEAGIS